jgi:hypothetical protein
MSLLALPIDSRCRLTVVAEARCVVLCAASLHGQRGRPHRAVRPSQKGLESTRDAAAGAASFAEMAREEPLVPTAAAARAGSRRRRNHRMQAQKAAGEVR